MNTSTAGMMAIAGILTLGGCGSISTTPEVDARFGESLSIIKAQQTINPDASRNTDPVAGIDGKAAQGAMVRYRESFGEQKEAEATPPALAVTQGAGGK